MQWEITHLPACTTLKIETLTMLHCFFSLFCCFYWLFCKVHTVDMASTVLEKKRHICIDVHTKQDILKHIFVRIKWSWFWIRQITHTSLCIYHHSTHHVESLICLFSCIYHEKHNEPLKNSFRLWQQLLQFKSLLFLHVSLDLR